jgi:hypothetical protein
LSPVALLRQEYTVLFRYTVALPEIHRFMREETLTNNPRLKWETVLARFSRDYCLRSLRLRSRVCFPPSIPFFFPT